MHSYPPAGPPPQPGSAPVTPPYPPGTALYTYGAPPPGSPPASPMRPKGGARKKVGIVLLVLGILPLLAGIAIEANNFSNAQQQVGNNDFAPKAWHNLESDEIFSDFLSSKNSDLKVQGWSRQGIAEEASCTDVLAKELAKYAELAGCRTVLRATYVDSSGELAATIALVVVDSSESAELLGEQFGSGMEPRVRPAAFPGTSAAKWKTELAVAGDVKSVGHISTSIGSPYLACISIGSVDSSRTVGELPEPWAFQGRDEMTRYWNIAGRLLSVFSDSLRWKMEGR